MCSGHVLEESNRGLRHGGAALRAGIIGVVVLGTEFWGDLSAKRRENSNLKAERKVWHLVDTSNLPGCRAGVGMVNSSRGTVTMSQVQQRWT